MFVTMYLFNEERPEGSFVLGGCPHGKVCHTSAAAPSEMTNDNVTLTPDVTVSRGACLPGHQRGFSARSLAMSPSFLQGVEVGWGGGSFSARSLNWVFLPGDQGRFSARSLKLWLKMSWWGGGFSAKSLM